MDYGPPGPPSMGFSRQEYCSGVPLPSPAGHNSGWAYYIYLELVYLVTALVKKDGKKRKCSRKESYSVYVFDGHSQIVHLLRPLISFVTLTCITAVIATIRRSEDSDMDVHNPT